MGGGETDLLVVGWAGENSIRFSGGLAANLNIRDIIDVTSLMSVCWLVGPIGLT